MITIDGIVWPIPCKITREAEIKPSEISGLLLDKSYFNDVIGTYMTYTISIAVPMDMRDQYAAIYEILTDPVDGHTFILPYNGSTVTITGRVENVQDEYVRLAGGGVYWRGTQFTVIANHPTKYYSLSEALTRGRAPLPEVSVPHEGDTWHYTDGAWVYGSGYDDADEIYY